MIYDCFLYNGEIDLLKIRLDEFKGLPVLHVPVEANYTFSGIKKPAYFTERDHPYFNQLNIRQIVLSGIPETNPWENEKKLRNSISRMVEVANDNDIIIISDVDEIPRASAIKDWKGEYAALMMDKFGFWLNCEEQHQGWHRARIMRYSYMSGKTPDEIRNSGFPEQIDNAGWHWSWLGGIDEVMRKFASFSHQEIDVQKHANREELMRKIATGESIWSKDPWAIIPIDSTFPQYVQDHQEELKHLIFKP